MSRLAAAEKFYESKLANNPQMPRYNHFMGAINAEKGNVETANGFFRNTIGVQPHNLMARNDYAVHLANNNRKHDAIHELKKGMLVSEEDATLHENMGAILGNSGQYNAALTAATRARYLNPYDAMNHRNLAKLHGALGDARSALQHNMMSVQLENPRAVAKPNTSAFRQAAVQLIAKGGTENREEAYRLMSAARSVEKKHIDLPSSTLTYELISRIKKRYGTSLADIERQQQELANKKKAYDYDDPNNIIHEIRKMKLTKSVKS